MDIQLQDYDFVTPNRRVVLISAGPDDGTFISSEVSSDGKSVCVFYDAFVFTAQPITDKPIIDNAIAAIEQVLNIHENHVHPQDRETFTKAISRLNGMKRDGFI